MGCECVQWGEIPPSLHTGTGWGGRRGRERLHTDTKQSLFVCEDRPHSWVSWGHAAAGTCGKEMYLSQALDIHVIQYIAPMCKKLTKLAPFQIAGKCRVSGTEAQPLLIHSAFYFNWVGLRTSRGCSRGPRLAGARGPAVRGGDIPPALPGAGAHPNRHHGKVTQGPPGPETSSAGPQMPQSL